MPKKAVDFDTKLSCEEKSGIHVLAEIEPWLQKIRQQFPDPAPKVKVSDPERRYRMASAAQKAFRRGIGKTLEIMLAGLHAVDGNYTWRRFSILVMEDVGMACPPAEMAKILVLARGKYLREHFGVTVDDLCRIARMVNSYERDRCATYLAVEMEHTPEKKRADYLHLPKDDLGHVQVDFYMARDSMKEMEKALEAHGVSDPYICFSTMEGTRQKIDGSLVSMYPLAYLLFDQTCKSKDDEFPALAWVGSYPTCCFDQYVGDSSPALSYFLKMNDVEYVEALRSITQDKKQQLLVTKKLLFRVEGGCLCRRLQYKAALEAMKRAYKLIIYDAGISWDDYRKLEGLLFKAIPKMNVARAKTILP